MDNKDGSMNYPPNNGAVPGSEKSVTLQSRSPGGGLQYVLPKPIQWYLDNNYLGY
ncbi:MULTISPECIES: hypothetical protein [unclassified Breznakia]|uniref:hypothetical protein n=1 Tax=unclassified Breznakia TaxID=2623764 RepID=UPI0024073274|nr:MULTISPECIES: hypothetical protein [unclassified Breznakia]